MERLFYAFVRNVTSRSNENRFYSTTTRKPITDTHLQMVVVCGDHQGTHSRLILNLSRDTGKAKVRYKPRKLPYTNEIYILMVPACRGWTEVVQLCGPHQPTRLLPPGAGSYIHSCQLQLPVSLHLVNLLQPMLLIRIRGPAQAIVLYTDG